MCEILNRYVNRIRMTLTLKLCLTNQLDNIHILELFFFLCTLLEIGNSVARGCFLETFCREQPHCYACNFDYCNGAISTNNIFKILVFVPTIIGLLLSRGM